jgi:hypothetical protein
MTDTRFAKVPADVLLALAPCPSCVVLYALLALEVGGTDWERTVTYLAKALRWRRQTAYVHAQHLADGWFIDLARQGPGASARVRLLPQPVRFAHTPSGNDGNGMDDAPLEAEFPVHEDGEPYTAGVRETHTSCARNGHPLGSSTGSRSTGYSRDALAEQPCSEGRRDERSSRVTVGRLGSCDVCGKRWVFGPCAHGGPELEAVS